MNTTPIPDCPQPETPLRTRAYTPAQLAARQQREPTRDHHVAGQRPDWAVHPLNQPPRRPQALRRRDIEDIKARWFAAGSLATTLVLALLWIAALVAGAPA